MQGEASVLTNFRYCLRKIAAALSRTSCVSQAVRCWQPCPRNGHAANSLSIHQALRGLMYPLDEEGIKPERHEGTLFSDSGMSSSRSCLDAHDRLRRRDDSDFAAFFQYEQVTIARDDELGLGRVCTCNDVIVIRIATGGFDRAHDARRARP